MLDEPTNDLDIETLELLESLLVEYRGTVLLVSHDRAFLNDVVTSTLAIEADGTVKGYDGGYDDYLRQRQNEAPPESRPAPVPASAESMNPQVDRPRKLSYKERRELDALPGRIEALEEARRALHEAMADPAFYRKDSGEIAEASAKLEALRAGITARTSTWTLGGTWRVWPTEKRLAPQEREPVLSFSRRRNG